MIFEDVVDNQKESLNVEYPIPSSTTVDVHSPASAALACNSPSGLKSRSGIIFILYFSPLHLLKISKLFLNDVILPCGCYTECYVMPMSSLKSSMSFSRFHYLEWLHWCALIMSLLRGRAVSLILENSSAVNHTCTQIHCYWNKNNQRWVCFWNPSLCWFVLT